MLGWQLTGPLSESVGASLSPSSYASFYAPVVRFLQRATRGGPIRVEVPFTSSHWDATVLGAHFMLARGWERQLDTRYDRLFYQARLSAAGYHSWLLANGVSYVALSDAPLDFSSVQEAALIRGGLPFLRLTEQTRHWRIYEVRGAQPLADGPGSLRTLNGDGFSIAASRPGAFLVRVHYTPYWSVVSGSATLGPAPDDWTEVMSDAPARSPSTPNSHSGPWARAARSTLVAAGQVFVDQARDCATRHLRPWKPEAAPAWPLHEARWQRSAWRQEPAAAPSAMARQRPGRRTCAGCRGLLGREARRAGHGHPDPRVQAQRGSAEVAL